MLLATEDGLKPSETGLNSFIRLEWRLVLSHKLEAIFLVLTDEELLDATLFDAQSLLSLPRDFQDLKTIFGILVHILVK